MGCRCEEYEDGEVRYCEECRPQKQRHYKRNESYCEVCGSYGDLIFKEGVAVCCDCYEILCEEERRKKYVKKPLLERLIEKFYKIFRGIK